jgi:hypothetical protein
VLFLTKTFASGVQSTRGISGSEMRYVPTPKVLKVLGHAYRGAASSGTSLSEWSAWIRNKTVSTRSFSRLARERVVEIS